MKRSYLVEDKDKTTTMQLDDDTALWYLHEGYRLKMRKPLLENNLYVTFGCRAGEMNQLNEIDLPSGVDGEEELAIFAEDCIGEWMRDQPDMSYDEFIESKLSWRFGVERN